MKSAEVRRKFLEYFQSHGHEIVPSSSLVPANDPTLLFTNAGMVQFKEVFLGTEVRACLRATSSQRCVRAGGKHNDLENVGYTARHHTFFEMLGNFSFGEYFKEQAIIFAWEFLTRELKLPAEKLWITVFEDDDEAASVWIDKVGVDPERFSRLGEKDNFWAMGDTGPCGPCSEIFYDHGEEVAGGPPGSPDEDGDRYIEIWNLVFMQYDRQSDGELIPLPKPSVDTGMGLERVAAIMQNVHNNYDIDLFQELLKAGAKITGVADLTNTSLRVIADHIRSCAFLVVDGVIPSNEGRGYVLRRIIRRAVRHGYQLGVKESFFYKLVQALVEVMGEAYPELTASQKNVEKVLLEEEQQFARTLENGMGILEQAIKELDGNTLAGDTVFQLYDTYGFPVDLTADVAREHNLEIDMQGFDKAMEVQRNKARAASQFTTVGTVKISLDKSTQFSGYENLQGDATVLALYQNGTQIDDLDNQDPALVLLDCSPFYGESGGQVGDRGVLKNPCSVFTVVDTQKQGEYILHNGSLRSGVLKVGDKLTAQVAAAERVAITLNHSATHLVHAALRKVLGDHVTQKGSLVNAKHLRFDFSHNSPLSAQEIEQIETLVSEQILANTRVEKEVMDMEQARNKGAMALFGEKYGDEVRVITMGGEFSTELCGGTHVERTGDISVFKLVGESGIAAGVRRIEAVTGQIARDEFKKEERTLQEVCALVRSSGDSVVEKVQQLVKMNKTLEKQLQQLKAKMAAETGSDLASEAETIENVKVLVSDLQDFNSKALRDTVDQLKNKLGSAVIVLATVNEGKVSIVAGVTKDLTDKVQAGDLVNMVAQQVGGRGGGRADMAMAGGSNPEALANALTTVKPWLADRL